MSSGIHCDGPACDTWAKADMADRSGFLTVFSGVYAMATTFVAHFCSWDCLMKYSAFQQPLDSLE